MAEPSTVARPYAEAVFRLADAAGALGKWSEMLAELAQVSADARVRAAVADPKRTDAQVAGLFISILSGKLTGDAENFVRVLAENGRLNLLPFNFGGNCTDILQHFIRQLAVHLLLQRMTHRDESAVRQTVESFAHALNEFAHFI